jgi:hypothetical protein
MGTNTTTNMPASSNERERLSDATDCDKKTDTLYNAPTLLHPKPLYRLGQILRGKHDRPSALKDILNGASETVNNWKEVEVNMLETVIERVRDFSPVLMRVTRHQRLRFLLISNKMLGEMKAPSEAALLQSWTGKISQQNESLILKEIVKTSEHAVAGGGFADIYTGEYRGQKVALKVLRIHGKQRDRDVLLMVRSFLFPETITRCNMSVGSISGSIVLEVFGSSLSSTIPGRFTRRRSLPSMPRISLDVERKCA